MTEVNLDQTFVFTERRIRDLPEVAVGKRVRYRDEDCPGLILRVTRGAKVFAFRIWKAEVTIGKWPAWSVEQARSHVRTKVAPDPKEAQAQKRAEREAQTLGEAWAALEAHPFRRDGKGRLREGTVKSYQLSWRHLQPWAGRPLEEITAPAVTGLRDRILSSHGPARCRQVMALLGILLGRMPRGENGRIVGKPPVEPRRRFMNSAELGALLRGLDAEPALWRVFWLCCLFAPLRRGNIASAKWVDVHLDSPARWIVDATSAKGRKMLAMPIIEPLAVVLRDWRRQNPGEAYLFPAGLTGCPGRKKYQGPIVQVQHAWKRAVLYAEAVRLCDAIGPVEGKTGRERFAIFLSDLEALRDASWRAGRDRQSIERDGTPQFRAVALLQDHAKSLGIDPKPLAMPNLCPHDLRRTSASWAVQSGASLAVVAASLGHADTRTTEAHYGHLSDDPIRKMLHDNAGRMLASVEGVKL